MLGEGFVEVTDENNNVAYTRNGNIIINSNGNMYLNGKNRINIKYNIDCVDSILTIDQVGNIHQKTNSKEIFLGRIDLYRIEPSEISNYLDGLVYYKQKAEKITTNTKIIQGLLESSNVNIEKTLFRILYILTEGKKTSIANIDYKEKLVLLLLNNYLKIKPDNIREYQNYMEKLLRICPFLAFDY